MPSAMKLKKMTASSWTAENEGDSAAGAKSDDPPSSEGEKQKDKPKKKSQPQVESFLDAPEFLDAKRKRTIPKEEQKMKEWLKENFLSDPEGTVGVLKLYDLFQETCVVSGINLPDLQTFKRVLNEAIGDKPYKIKDESGYKGMIKETKKKVNREKKEGKEDSIKPREVILEALKEGGSPKKGLRFGWIKQYLMSKYPSLKYDIYPVTLRNALDRLVRNGDVDLVKGIGFAGFFRLPGEYPESEDEKKTKKTKKKEKKDEEKKEEDENKEGDSAKEGEVAKENGVAKGGEDAEEGELKTDGESKNKDTKNKKKRKKKKPARRPQYHRVSRHVEPQTISDVFPMAMTFMCEPKDASVTKIKKYIEKYFSGTDISNNRMKAALVSGCEKGIWEQVSGVGAAVGSYRLQVDDLNPTHCKTLEDMICLAMLACHEPKQSSVRLLKTYIQEYHPNFNIDRRPHLLKNAIEKEEKKGNIIRLTGIGSTGSFQLANPFTPSPAWLAGVDESSDEEEDAEILEFYVPEKEQAYKARPSKRRGMARAAAATGRQPDFISYSTSSDQPAKRRVKKRKPKVEYEEDSDDSESEEEEAPPPPPKKSKSRSKPAAKKPAAPKKTAAKKTAAKKSPVKKAKSSKSVDSEDEEETGKRSRTPRKPQYKEDSELDSDVEVTPPKKNKNKKALPKKSVGKSPSKSSKKRASRDRAERVSYVEDSEEEYEARPSDSRSRSASASKGKNRRVDSELDLFEEESDEPVSKSKSPPKSSSKKRKTEDLDDDLEEKRPSKSKSDSKRRREDSDDEFSEHRSKSKSKSSSKKRQVESEDESDYESPPKASKKKGKYLEPESDDDEDYERRKSSKSKSKSASRRREPSSDEDASENEQPPKGKKKLAEPLYDSEEEGEVRPSSKRSYDSESEEDRSPKVTKKSSKKSSKKRRR